MRALLANPRGFCAGVARAIDIVEQALQKFGPPIYVRHAIVHNDFVVADLSARGVVFVDELHEVPNSSVVIFSAHGVSKAVHHEAAKRQLKVIDATCPLVTKVHHQVDKLNHADYEIIVVGHTDHVEVLGTVGQVVEQQHWRVHVVETVEDVATLLVNNSEKLGYVTQTTLSVEDTKEIIDALKLRFPKIVAPPTEDICYATYNRQEAVKTLSKKCDVIFVVGSKTSSNSNSLRILAELSSKPAYLIDGPQDIDPDSLRGKNTVGITAGASAPDILIKRVVEQLQQWGLHDIQEITGNQENVSFRVPRIL